MFDINYDASDVTVGKSGLGILPCTHHSAIHHGGVMIFISDNATGVCPEIMHSLQVVNEDSTIGYGNDPYTKRMELAFDTFFEKTVHAFPIAIGTAANALAVGTLCPPWGAIFCHGESHLYCSECGAPEMFTGGAKLIELTGKYAKICPEDLDLAIRKCTKGNPHVNQPAVASISQIAEAGVAYTLEEIKTLAEVAHQHDMYFHMDGARFANAVVSLGSTPAEMTWKSGVDVMSFGASKNGAMMAEAVVFFNSELVRDFEFRRKRAGHLISKMRFVSVQLETYLTNNLWYKNADNANKMARYMRAGLAKIDGVDLVYPVDANQVFVTLSQEIKHHLRDGKYDVYSQGGVVRFVTSFNTTEQDVDDFISAVIG